MWLREEYKLFHIYIQVIPLHDDASQRDSYGYNGYIRRSAPETVSEDRVRRFHNYAQFPDAKAAIAAAFAEGKSIVDGTHASLSVEEL